MCIEKSLNQQKIASVVVSMVVPLANLDCHVDFNVFVLIFRSNVCKAMHVIQDNILIFEKAGAYRGF